jgi:hypothetical protein
VEDQRAAPVVMRLAPAVRDERSVIERRAIHS